MGGEAVPHDGLDELVVDELSDRHRAADLGADLRVMGHVPPEDVTHADVDELELGGEQLRLRALAAALYAHDDVLAHARLSRVVP